MKRNVIGLNDVGRVVGEGHYKAKLSDEEVEKIRDLREHHGFTYGMIARRFGASKDTIVAICSYRRRCTTPARFKRIG